MTKKVFRAIMLVAGAVLLSSLVIIMGCLYGYFGSVQEKQLADEAELAAVGTENSGVSYLEKIESNRFRVTWIAGDGSVIYDTQSDASAMENHIDREEIREALETGTGKSVRYSSTLLEQTVYSAKRLSDGTVLRVSISRLAVGALAFGMVQPTLVVLAAALILAFILAGRISKRIVGPLNNLNLDKPLDNNAYEELSPLLTRLNKQQLSISEQIKQLKEQRDEFSQITDNMKEGLVLLDINGTVISINPTAGRLFGAEGSCVGKNFLTVDRSRDMSRAIERAIENGHGETRAERAGRVYQFDISRIDSGGTAIGAVLLAFDVTEQEFGERNRREFTANVSHELKTPLQSIIGSAELIENNMVKQEDMPRFIGHIRQEAMRLVALIEDIIRLSQLDEGNDLPIEDINLLYLANEVADNLINAAEAKNLRVSVSGEEATVRGVRRLIYETIFNLCDNAIKYNRTGGQVDIVVSRDGNAASITVKDTGIGIPVEHQDRVFERFYRVDKSHSKASGGTGLGLSIVKHAVMYHHGKITLESEVDKGTSVTVTLPADKDM